MAVLLELKGVGKAFGATRVLEQIDLAVEDGEFITILGPSGSGKTTILRMIGGFIQPDSGAILLDVRDIARDPINRRPFNTVFQDYALFPRRSSSASRRCWNWCSSAPLPGAIRRSFPAGSDSAWPWRARSSAGRG
jgi:ABC-type multidrug transport system ATPase subunit